ncbi:hypothetical protein [Actinoallomurus acaciae]|uniref:Uncharacterized protein n=1 Tax=Actinoallomurus acaciae TaxID=502577 RepID=A0ABV5Y8I7_9ACTN
MVGDEGVRGDEAPGEGGPDADVDRLSREGPASHVAEEPERGAGYARPDRDRQDSRIAPPNTPTNRT